MHEAANITETLLLSDAKSTLKEHQNRTRLRRSLFHGSLALVVIHWFVITPSVLVAFEGWTFPVAIYYSVQAGLGIGFGALQIHKDFIFWILLLQLLSGTVLVSFLVSFILADLLEGAEARAIEARARSPACVELVASSPAPWHGVAIAGGVLSAVLVSGVAYGLVYEQWSFARSLLFVVSLCQTSGLEAPSITPASQAMPCLPVALLCLVGVPTWAYFVGSLAQYLAHSETRRTRLVEAMQRERRAEAAYARCHRNHSLSPSSEITEHVFLELWLLRNDLVSEATLQTVRDEFEALSVRAELDANVKLYTPHDSPFPAPTGRPTLQGMTARLKALQMQQLAEDA